MYIINLILPASVYLSIAWENRESYMSCLNWIGLPKYFKVSLIDIIWYGSEYNLIFQGKYFIAFKRVNNP